MNKTIRKIIALGTMGVMAATPLAFAVTLADYPAPFVTNGAFSGKIVIGSSGNAVADFLGVVDIAASLQRASSTAVTTTGTTTNTVEDGYKFQENENLILGGDLNDVITGLDDTELETLLASGTMEDDDGSEYDYDVEVDLATSAAIVSADVVGADLDGTYPKPIVFFDLKEGSNIFYKVTVDFNDIWDTADFTESETFELFGRAYTLDPTNMDSDKLTLYGSDTTIIVAKGETQTLTYNSKEYTVTVTGGNSDDSSAIVRIGSETKTVQEGDSKTIGGLPVYIKDVFVSNIGGDDVSVQLFVGSNKIELDNDGTVTLNGVDLDEVTFSGTYTYTAGLDGVGDDGEWSNIDILTFTVKPYDADGKVEYILPGKSYVDPLFGAFKFDFVGAKDLAEGKELIQFERNGKKLDLTFTPRGASEATTTTIFEGTTTVGAVYEDFWDVATFNDLEEDAVFLYNEKYDGTTGTEDDAITHVLQVKKITAGNNASDEDFEVVVEDLTFGGTYTVDSTTKALDSKIALYAAVGGTADQIDFSVTSGGTASAYNATYFTIFTDAGAKLVWVVNSTNATAITAGNQITGLNTFIVTEDVDDDAETATVDPFNVDVSYDGTTDDEYDLSVSAVATFTGDASDDDDNYDYYLTKYGTYVVEETDDSGKNVDIYVPAEEVAYDMFLAPVASKVTTSTSGTGGAVSVNPIAVGMAILDSDAKALGTMPYIVVGGPCVNSVAAGLLGNPVDCTTGFLEGKAKIKFFADKNALLVAGYSAKDTQGASRVLAEYKTYKADLVGTEVEVVTTTLSDLKVNKVQ
ncbi:MAG: hypothetical protein WC916_06240 [Candidatus Woesearchaeota archaeon]